MDNPERKIQELERELRIQRERLKFLESEIKKKDDLINSYWDRIQSMRLVNRVKRILLPAPIRRFVKAIARSIKVFYDKVIEARAIRKKRVAIIRRFRSRSRPVKGPLVSVIVANSNGINYLKPLIRTFRRNAGYRNYEIIVVGNNSTDDSLDFLTHQKGVRLIRSEVHITVSAANNLAAKEAKGDLVLFLNSDVLPIRGWLRELIGFYVSQNTEQVGVVGSLLIYPYKAHFERSFSVQHNGVMFTRDRSYFRLYNEDNGKDPFDVDDRPQRRAAVTGDCMLVERKKFLEAGGFDERYHDGLEDIDLCLTLQARGNANYVCRRSVLFHHGFGTQQQDVQAEVVSERKANALYFSQKWYRFLYRNMLKELLEGSLPVFTTDKLCIGIIAGEYSHDAVSQRSLAFDVHGALNAADFDVRTLEGDSVAPDISIVVVTNPRYDISKVQSTHRVVSVLWLDHYNLLAEEGMAQWCKYDFAIVKTKEDGDRLLKVHGLHSVLINDLSSGSMSRLRRAVVDWIDRPAIAFKVPAPDWQTCRGWGDFHFAISLKKEFERSGWATSVQLLDEWYNEEDWISDAVLVLRGRQLYQPKSLRVNMMWNISHPDMVSLEEYKTYDHVFVASGMWATHLRSVGLSNVSELLQCTDLEIFHPPDQSEGVFSELLFVGNSRGELRKVIKDLVPTSHNLSIYGRGWGGKGLDQYVKGEYIDNKELYKYYGGARIVLNDHWDDMREKGFISNRIFDALACGAMVVSDDVAGVKELFGEAVAVYNDEKELASLISELLSKGDGPISHEGIKHHSVKKRVDVLLRVLHTLC